MSRLNKIRESMKKREIEALLVTSPYNLRYVSNFTGTTGLSLITLEKAYFVTDFRYTEQAATQAVGFEIVKNNGPIFDEVARLVEKDSIETLGFEQDYVSYSTFEQLEQIISSELIPVSALIEELREVKDFTEIEIIKKACSISDAAFSYILGVIKPGMSEIEVANLLDFHMRELGATGVSFETIVASGIRSAMPHGVASKKLIETGDFVTIDFGCYYEGYVSDMTRTIAIGEPDAKLKEICRLS